jgi:hypothetical protein
MRALGLALCLTLSATAGARAQEEAPLMPTPPPTDFTKPFQYDRAPFHFPGREPPFIRGRLEDVALPVEVIGREELIARGNPSMEELLRALRDPGVAGYPVRPNEVTTPNCYFDIGETIDLESRAIACNGVLRARTPEDPGR